MQKICPKCRLPQRDERFIACEACKATYVAPDEIVGHFTREELSFIARCLLKDLRVLLAASIVILVAFTTVLKSARQIIVSKVKEAEQDMTNRIASVSS